MKPRRRQLIPVEALLAATPPTGVSDELRAFVAANERPRPEPRALYDFTAADDTAIAALTDALRRLTRWSPVDVYLRARDLGLRLDELPAVDRWIEALEMLDEHQAVAVRAARARERTAEIELEWAHRDADHLPPEPW